MSKKAIKDKHRQMGRNLSTDQQKPSDHNIRYTLIILSFQQYLILGKLGNSRE